MKKKLIMIAEIILLIIVLVLVRTVLGTLLPDHEGITRFISYGVALGGGLLVGKMNQKKK